MVLQHTVVAVRGVMGVAAARRARASMETGRMRESMVGSVAAIRVYVASVRFCMAYLYAMPLNLRRECQVGLPEH